MLFCDIVKKEIYPFSYLMKGEPMKASILKITGIMVTLSLIFSLALTGCGSGTPKDKVGLKVGLSAIVPATMDPTQEAGGSILFMMYDSLSEVSVDGTASPGIVKEWDMATDGLSWTLTLRNDVNFHSGVNADGTAEPARKMTSADVAYSFQRVAKGKAFGAQWVQLLGENPKIEIIDDSTLRVYTNGAQGDLPILSANVYNPYMFVFPKAYIEKNGAEYFGKHPIGTGPFKFVSYIPGDRIEFEAVAKHWRVGKPEFDLLTIYEIPEETTRVAMLERGELDATSVSLDTAVDMTGNKEGIKVINGALNYTEFYFVGAYRPEAAGMPLGDIRVRQALSLAINRQELLDTLFHGLGEWPSPIRLGKYFADLTPELKAKGEAWVKENCRYDTEAAKKLLKDAGYAEGLSFEFWSAPDSEAPYVQDLVVAAANYWEKIGVHCTIVTTDAATWKAKRVARKSPDLIGKMGAIAGGAMKPNTFQAVSYFTNYGSMDVLAGSPLEAEMTSICKEGIGSIDPVRKEQLMNRVYDIITSTWCGIPMVVSPTPYLLGPRVSGNLPPTAQTIVPYLANFKYAGENK